MISGHYEHTCDALRGLPHYEHSSEIYADGFAIRVYEPDPSRRRFQFEKEQFFAPPGITERRAVLATALVDVVPVSELRS